jgi:hypothetical protein
MPASGVTHVPLVVSQILPEAQCPFVLHPQRAASVPAPRQLVPSAAPTQSAPSSLTPLQFSSPPPHVSVPGAVGTASQRVERRSLEHVSTPLTRHAPTPALQTMPRFGKPSSVVPSQSSSAAEPHSSVAGAPGVALQAVDKRSVEHTSAPVRRHVPTPTAQDDPRLGKPSSVFPSQSSSSPEPQSSVLDGPATAPHVVESRSIEQAMVPVRRQLPTPAVQLPPTAPKPSSVLASQSSSAPEPHNSVLGAPAVALQTTAPPPPQTFVPERLQLPTPTEQLRPRPRPSSADRSQSSSIPLQSSVRPGRTARFIGAQSYT